MIQVLSISLIIFSLIFASRSEKINDPSLKPAASFSASADAGVIFKEIKKDFTTNKDKLVDIWFHRTYDQRVQITQYYNDNFCAGTAWGSYRRTSTCPLVWGIETIAQGDMSDLYKVSQWPFETILAKTVYDTITGHLKEVGAIEEVLCANDKEIKDHISKYYQIAYSDSIENHVGAFRGNDEDYQHVMQGYCWKGLCQEKKIKPQDADKEAKALRNIDPDKDKDGFKKKLIEILDKNCEPDVKMIFEKYRQDKNGIEDAVDKAFDVKRVRRAYNRLVRYIENTCKFYADELEEAVQGFGTKEDKINRIIVTRSERDLLCILNKYKELHGKTFTNRLKTDTTDRRWLKAIRYLCGKE